ncbi:hypothetical protein D3C72_1427710 [compost metagenome]
MVTQIIAQRLGLLAAQRRQFVVMTRGCQLAVTLQDMEQEEAKPDALATPLQAHHIHAVVPVTGSHQRQTVFAEVQSVF